MKKTLQLLSGNEALALGAYHAGVQVATAYPGTPTTETPGTSVGPGLFPPDDPQIHSPQNEQDNRHYARMAKVPMLEPTDSQEAYDIMAYAFDISEKFDTPVMVRSTPRISHSTSLVD